MNVTAGSLGLASSSMNTSSSTLYTVNVSAINGSGNSLTPTETHNTLAYIAGGSTLGAGGAEPERHGNLELERNRRCRRRHGERGQRHGFLAVSQHKRIDAGVCGRRCDG